MLNMWINIAQSFENIHFIYLVVLNNAINILITGTYCYTLIVQYIFQLMLATVRTETRNVIFCPEICWLLWLPEHVQSNDQVVSTASGIESFQTSLREICVSIIIHKIIPLIIQFTYYPLIVFYSDLRSIWTQIKWKWKYKN